MRVFAALDELAAATGEHLGYSDWHRITQEQVDQFAAATGDHQWIHVDPDRAKAGPFGTTIAHGYLTLALLPVLTAEIYRVDGLAMGVNYGLDRVRFPTPVPVGARVRAGAQLLTTTPADAGLRVTVRVTVESDAADKPACVADAIALLVP